MSTVGKIEQRMRRACVLALAALMLIAWSLVQPAPLPVIGAMTVGQVLGTGSLLFFLYAIAADLRTELLRVRARALMPATSSTPPPPPASKPEPPGDDAR